MPSIKSNQQAGQKAIENGQLVRATAPAVDVAPPTPPLTNTNQSNAYLRTPLPASYVQQPDQQRSWQAWGVVPQSRVPPLPAASSATTGSTAASTAFTQTGPIAIVAAEANTTAQAASTTASAAQTTANAAASISIYSGVVAYVVGNEVNFTDGNTYKCILATTGNAPPNATFWTLVGPTSLTAVPDGSQRFAATGSTLTYRPTTNPLTATDAGSNATVNIASFTMRTSSKGDISVNSGSITVLSYSTLYYIYYDDATLAGGAVTFIATTTKVTAINGSGRFFVGSIVTPAATAPNTTGNGDGGVGAQYGSASVFLFGAQTNSSTGTGFAVSNPQNAIDGNLTTFATLANGSGGGAGNSTIIVSAASPTSAPWQSLTLNVLTALSVPVTGDNVTLSYSVDGGNSFTTIYSVNTNRSLTTDSVTLSSAQNLALVQVKLVVTSGGQPNLTGKFYEAWTVGTT
jgi:hypothetical protein